MSENESRALTPAEHKQPVSEAQQRRQRMEALVSAVEQKHDMLVTLLRDTGIKYERFVEVFRRAIIKGQEKPQTDLLLVDAGSVIQACIDSCTAGLVPDGKQGAIVIYNVNVAGRGQPKRWIKKAQFIAMYEGLLHIAYSSGNFQSIMAHVVYEGDDFDYALGIDPYIRHKPAKREALPTDEDGKPIGPGYKITHAYAVAKTKDGGVFVEVFEPEDIRKVMAVSRAKSGPARDWPEAMSRKGPLRRMWKFLPRNDRMDRVLEIDDENYDLEGVSVPAEETAPKLKTGFAPRPQPALTQDATPAMPEVRERETLEQQREVVQENIRDAMGMDEPPLPPGADDYGEQDVPDVIVDTFDDDAPPPAGDTYPPRIQEFRDRLATCQSWLNIKQAIRSLLKAEDWDREQWEQFVMSISWARKEELGDRTDFVTDALLFIAWLDGSGGHDNDTIRGNLSVLEAQADYKRAPEEIQDWVQRRVREIVTE